MSTLGLTAEVDNPILDELNNGVLIQDDGFISQGSGISHALSTLNVSNRSDEVEQSCSAVKLLDGFVLTYD